MDCKWWHDKTVYQVYPKSFNDTTGNGVGDIKGITEKLDYLQELGIGIIWISPLYQSPMDDNGYDISDYYQVDPSFGTMSDLEHLISAAAKKEIRIVMDLVVNHTSDEHPWFIESKSSLDNPKRDWYIWKKPRANGGPPNNWGSFFTRSAWALEASTNEYYLHLFSEKQPDLNWANPEVRNAIYDMMHFWLKKGIGGFRMDVINMIGKPNDFRDASILDEGIPGWEYWANNSRTHEYLREMNDQVLSKYDIVTVGETLFTSSREGRLYSHKDRHELNMIFHFEHMAADGAEAINEPKALDLPKLKAIMSRWQDDLYGKGWNSNYWSNHDQARSVSRFGNDGDYRVQSAKMLGATLHFMSGTPYVYQGEEIGLTNTYYDNIDDYNDLKDHHQYDLLIHDQGLTPEEALKRIQPYSRDNARVPMPWSNGVNAGFTTGRPWLKMNLDKNHINVAKALDDPDSVFWFYKELIRLRKESPYSNVMTYGRHQLLLPDHPRLYAYQRYDESQRLLILSNFSVQPCHVAMDVTVKDVIMTNYKVVNPSLKSYQMSPYETLVVSIC